MLKIFKRKTPEIQMLPIPEQIEIALKQINELRRKLPRSYSFWIDLDHGSKTKGDVILRQTNYQDRRVNPKELESCEGF